MPCLCIPFEAKPSLIFYKLHNVTGFPLGSRLRVGMYNASDQKSGDYKDAGWKVMLQILTLHYIKVAELNTSRN